MCYNYKYIQPMTSHTCTGSKKSAEEVNCNIKNLRLHPNEIVPQLKTDNSEAYETVGKPPVSQVSTESHLYDEVTQTERTTELK